MEKMGLKHKASFQTINGRIQYMIENDFQLDYAELDYIFNNCAKLHRFHYVKLCNSIRTLLKEAEGEMLNALVELLNVDFEYEPAWYVDIWTLKDRFELWQYKCINPETAKVLIKTVEDIEREKKNASLDKFKQTLER